MNILPKLLTLALLATACGRPLLQFESDGEGSTTQSSTTETSTTQISTTEASTTEPGTSGFVPDQPDPPESCHVLLQDCPEGQKCVLYASDGNYWDGYKCVPVLGEGAPGDPCTYRSALESTDDCDATSFCWDVVDGMGYCRVFCSGTGDDPICPEDHGCLIWADGGAFVCIFRCDPLAQNCEEGLACYWANSDFDCMTTRGDIPTGQPCGYINDCADGDPCLIAEVLPNCAGSACCSPWCQLGGNGQECAELPGTACAAFFEAGTAPPGHDDVGVCILP